MGKTQILRALFARTGGVYLTSREFVEASAHRDPCRWTRRSTASSSRRSRRTTPSSWMTSSSSPWWRCCVHAYPRQNFLAAALLPLAALARDQGKKLVFTSEGMPLPGLYERFPIVPIAAFTETRLPGDLRVIPGRPLTRGSIAARSIGSRRSSPRVNCAIRAWRFVMTMASIPSASSSTCASTTWRATSTSPRSRPWS